MPLTKCPECSHEVSDKASSCPNCGHPLQAAIVQPPANLPPRIKPPAKQDDAASRLALGILVLLLFCGATWWAVDYFSSDSSSSAPAPQSPVISAAPYVSISDIRWSEIDAIYNLKSKYTDLQKDESWKQYKGKKVLWSGRVSSIAESLGNLDLQVKMNPDTFTSDLIIELKDSEKSKALGLKVGDSVRFTGILDAWGTLLPITLKDGEID